MHRRDVRIRTPCTADWTAMTGDERSRFCTRCSKRVYDLSAVTEAEARPLVRPGNCIRYAVDPSGRILHRPEPRSRRGLRAALWAAAAAILWAPGHASAGEIEGQVVNRHGEPVPRAIVRISPGNLELTTDRYGRFTIDSLRADASGERVRLAHDTEYTLTLYKAGYERHSLQVEYRRGRVEVDPVVLLPESDVDPDRTRIVMGDPL